jgi:2,4-dienoyl-CoA reductase (NADPH2)
MKYPHIFKEFVIRGQKFKNRVVMGSMHTGLEEKNDQFEALSKFYEVRAQGGVGLIITGGFSPNWTGRLTPFAADLSFPWQIKRHRRLTETVHRYQTKIFIQLLHAGRYAFHPWSASASSLKAPISPFKPRALSEWGIKRTIQHFVRAATLAEKAGYDGVEIMGSEGYLINQFLSEKTNQRKDQYGGTLENRARLACEIIQGIRKATSEKFIICFRISLMDLVQKGSTADEVIQFAKLFEKAGVDIFDSGIGWHESKVPTIYLEVPRAQFTYATELLKKNVKIPVMATNRINMPEVGEKILSQGQADFISLARPMLADPDWVNKAEKGEDQLINTCIACNQACLDHIFQNKRATCLVNPIAGFELEYQVKPAATAKKIAVIGSGPAGLQAAVTLAERGHKVTLFEKKDQVGGQLQYAAKIVGKEEFHETLRYFRERLKQLKIEVMLNSTISEKNDFTQFDEIVDARGVYPRSVSLPGIEKLKHWDYQTFLDENPNLNGPIVIIGGGPIAIDISETILKKAEPNDFNKEWGIDPTGKAKGWLVEPINREPKILITLCQRSSERIGGGLGKTSGWIHRDYLKRNKVKLLAGVTYKEVTSEGLVIQRKNKEGSFTDELLKAEALIICAGQESSQQSSFGIAADKVHRIGGVLNAKAIDAKRSIMEGFQVGLRL